MAMLGFDKSRLESLTPQLLLQTLGLPTGAPLEKASALLERLASPAPVQKEITNKGMILDTIASTQLRSILKKDMDILHPELAALVAPRLASSSAPRDVDDLQKLLAEYNGSLDKKKTELSSLNAKVRREWAYSEATDGSKALSPHGLLMQLGNLDRNRPFDAVDRLSESISNATSVAKSFLEIYPEYAEAFEEEKPTRAIPEIGEAVSAVAKKHAELRQVRLLSSILAGRRL